MYYPRYYDAKLAEEKNKLLKPGRVLIVYGPRRAGKTTLLQRYIQNFKGKVFYGVGEDRVLHDIFASQSVARIRSAFAGYNLIVIDEAQAIDKIGLGLKLLVDHLSNAKVIASGSSSFELSAQAGEPLTGRKRTILLYPLAIMELINIWGAMEIYQRVEEFLLYGLYPEIVLEEDITEKRNLLMELRDAYLFKDILQFERLKNANKLYDLLVLLAFQIGKEVSLSELGTRLGLAKQTVERYLDLLEKCFVIKKVTGFARNLRKEISKTARYYFLDNGILNAVINNFNPLSLRNDVGELWENFIFVERLKKQSYLQTHTRHYFWRTYDRQEIDLVEEVDGKLAGYEIKWRPRRKKAPKLWKNTYPEASFEQISKENFLEFIV